MKDEHWSERREGGGFLPMWLLMKFGMLCGRGAVHMLLYPITLYFFVRRHYERRVSYAFLTRAFGRPATAWQVIRHIRCFGATILDRMFLLSERYARFDIKVHGLADLTSRMRADRGVLLLGAHVGSFEALRVLASERPDVKVCALLDTQKTPAMTQILHSLNPAVAKNVIDASRPGPEIVLALGEALNEGALVTLLADRARAGEETVMADFMGTPAPFPVAPFLIGSLLKVPLVMCIGMYRGDNRYDLYFEVLADEVVLPRGERKAALSHVVQRYATRLEHYVRQDPYNWFNWHDFWKIEHDGGAEASPRGAALAGSVERSAPAG
jgi:predicted LPLAT superfamily acyltransferase